MKRILLCFVVLCIVPYLFGQETLEKIEIIGNERVTRDTVLYYLSSREGDYYSEELLRRDFRVLWSTGFFSNIRIEKEDGVRGKIVKIIVEENPVIKNIIYKTGKKLKENDITNKLKENDEYILPYSYYNEFKIKRIQETIEDLLLEKGLTSGKVKVKVDKKGKNELEVVFDISEGPKVRVGEVEFEGSTKLLKSVVRGAMKQNKKHGIIPWITGKDVFKQNKLSEDLESIKEKYREYGYMEVTVGEPRIEEITKRTVLFKKQKMKKIIIPVNPGYRYTVGEVKIEGNEILSTKGLRRLIKFKEGDVYSTKIREKSIEEIGEIYRNLGYIRSAVYPVEKLEPKRKRVNVTFNIIEGDVVYLGRLEFKGNTFTKDKVIRREMLLREGDRFSLALFKDSILRMSQLGLVEPVGEPEIRPDPKDPNKMDVVMNVKELQRNNIQFSAGYSGYEGTFIALSYSTVNFLGAGEKLELMVQHGKRIKNYMFGFSEPYFLDYPVSLGFNVYNRYIIYPFLFDQKAKGANLTVGGRVKGYLRSSLTYAYEYIDINAEEGSYYYDFRGGYGISSITPMVYRSTVNSPLTPTRGSLYMVSSKFSGGFLGGDMSFIKPRFEWSFFHPLVLNHVVGFHVEYQFIKVLGDSGVPIWEKFYLGGERSIRGYEIYSIRGDQNIGGEKSFVFNAEYIIPVGGPLYAIFFYDMGNAFARDQKINLSNLYSSTGLEVRIFVPALRVPFRLIFAYNNRKIHADDSNFAFRFAIGTTF
ncbi:MAG: outer membrane protein assembly factor BamA [Candidatus Aminicenantes bacterium]|nr:outer membrane protein assembly factor BamA [Candidatus Aminicenantes bacterium]